MQPDRAVDDLSSYSLSTDFKSVDEIHIDDLLRKATERGSSDLHLTVGLPPTVRVDGSLMPLEYVTSVTD